MSKCVYLYSSDFKDKSTLTFQFKAQIDPNINHIALVPAAIFPTIMLISMWIGFINAMPDHFFLVMDCLYI